MKKVIVFMADGMEECECLITVDLLKRAGISVLTASVMGRNMVTSSHGIRIEADCCAEDVDFHSFDAVVMPGGLPGADHLRENEIVRDACVSFASAGKAVAAICAAPRNLAAFGLLEGKKATVYPGFEKDMRGAVVTNTAVAVDGNIITGRALGAALPFALEIIKFLLGNEAAEQVADKIVL